MSKINTKKDLGIEAKEASVLLVNVLKEEGFSEIDVRGFPELVAKSTRKKVTIHEKDIFEEQLREIIRNCREHLKNKKYTEPNKQILDLFCDKTKSKLGMFVEDNRSYIAIVLPTMGMVLAVILKLV